MAWQAVAAAGLQVVGTALGGIFGSRQRAKQKELMQMQQRIGLLQQEMQSWMRNFQTQVEDWMTPPRARSIIEDGAGSLARIEGREWRRKYVEAGVDGQTADRAQTLVESLASEIYLNAAHQEILWSDGPKAVGIASGVAALALMGYTEITEDET